MKTKEKNVEMQDAVITKTSRGGYMAQGHDGKGNKLTTMLSEASALDAVKNGVAKKSWYIGLTNLKRYRFFISLFLLEVFKY